MIRVAILGAGIGAEHLEGYCALTDAFEVVSICDRDEDRARAIAGDIAIHADLNAALDDPQVDLIDICLPPHLHVPIALQALAVGKSVVCEKPIATSLADVDRLQAAQTDTGRLFPVFQYRFGAAMSQLRSLGAAGLLGQPHVASLETHWNRAAEYYAVPWRGTWAGEQGGAMLGHAIHVHDLLTSLFGPVAEVSARLSTRINDIETEDCAALSLRMANGALATSSVTLGAADDTTRIRLVFEGLTATSGSAPYKPMSDTWWFQSRDPAKQSQVEDVLADTGAGMQWFEGFLAEVGKAMRQEPNEAVTLAEGRASLDLVTATYASARAGGLPMTCPIPSEHPMYQGWQPDGGNDG